MSRAALVLALVSVLGCQPADDPAAAYRTFAAALQRGEAPVAWEALSRATREELTAAARAAAVALHKPPPKDGMALAFGDGFVLARKVKKVEVARRDGDRAQLTVTDEKDAQESVAVVREDGAWRVDLGDELRRATAR